MPEQDLDGAEVCSRIQQMRGKRVAPDVGAHLFFDADLLGQLLADLPDAGRMHGRAGFLPWKQPVRGPPLAPVGAQECQQLGREHDLTGPLAFPFPHSNHHALAVYIGDLELEHFGAT
jgi:hypothetical protein